MSNYSEDLRACFYDKMGYVLAFKRLSPSYPSLTLGKVRWDLQALGPLRSKTQKQFKQKESTVDPLMHNEVPKQDSLEIDKSGHHTSTKLLQLNSTQLKDPSYLMVAHGYDPKEWELLSIRNNIWNAYSKKDGIMELYSSKIVLKPKVQGITLEDITKHFENYKPTFTACIPNKIESNKMLEFPLCDLHIGKMAWEPESGENFDSKILKDRFYQVITDMIDRVSTYKFEKIILPFGNDLFNIDNIEGNTTGGTKQDNDLRIQKMFDIGAEMNIDLIAKLSDAFQCEIEIMLVTGNHSRLAEFYLIRLLEAYFRNTKHIKFDSRPCKRKYLEYGNTLIGFSHGETEKSRIGGLMPIEAPGMWGRTKYREFHLAHYHTEQMRSVETPSLKKQIQESDGLIVRNISSITGSDMWHYNAGYVGAVKKAQGFIYDKQHGLTDILNFVVK